MNIVAVDFFSLEVYLDSARAHMSFGHGLRGQEGSGGDWSYADIGNVGFLYCIYRPSG